MQKRHSIFYQLCCRGILDPIFATPVVGSSLLALGKFSFSGTSNFCCPKVHIKSSAERCRITMCQQKYLDTTKLCLKWPSSRATLYKHWTLSRLSMNLKWPWAKYKGQTCVSSVAHTHTHTKRRKRFSVLHPVSVRRSRTNQSCCSARSLSI